MPIEPRGRGASRPSPKWPDEETRGTFVEIGDIYRKHVVTCGPDATMADAANLMDSEDDGLVVVVEDGKVVGVVSERDLVRVVAHGIDLEVPVSEIATKDVLTVRADDTLHETARMMIDQRVRRFPVLSAAGDLIGLVSMRDLFAVDTLLPGPVRKAD